jgi:4-carboxymuconolactone decarboxylase
MTPRQREVAAAIGERRVGGLNGPYVPLLYSPEIADRAQLLGDYLRHNLRVPERLRVLAVLVAAGRYRGSDAAAFLQLDAIQESGLAASTIDALCNGRRPDEMTPDEEMVYEYCMELTRSGRVKGVTYDKLSARLGAEICLELVAVCGCASFLTMVINLTESTI